MKLLSDLLILSGIVFLIFSLFLVNARYSPNRLKFQNYNVQEVSSSSTSTPVAIKLNSVNINLTIKSTNILNGKWEAPSDAAAYLKSSPIPGDSGNSIIYGHNWSNIFGNLNDVQIGDEIEIFMDNGDYVVFKVGKVLIVNPTDTFILENSEDPTLTVYTCAGFLDTKRLVLVANLEKKS